jgi:hypothetical protein
LNCILRDALRFFFADTGRRRCNDDAAVLVAGPKSRERLSRCELQVALVDQDLSIKTCRSRAGGKGRSTVVMGDVVNLRRFRKKAERELGAQRAEENRARHGRTKAERARDTTSGRKLNDKLDQHRIGEEDR